YSHPPSTAPARPSPPVASAWGRRALAGGGPAPAGGVCCSVVWVWVGETLEVFVVSCFQESFVVNPRFDTLAY
ncbi:MAG: hypothetical protein OXI96_00705, partial [Acidimicrobiaceae bacterium]|nr:hypothetical protein [Acidimicrobiaceae bacterium]